LLPRSPQKIESSDRAGDPPKPRVYSGAEVETIAAEVPAKSSSSGEGFDLNFENTPVAQVAKVVLGDILGTGYTIDPRVQGSVSLASVRPVPKSDLIFVLESALRVVGVALVRDPQGYRLIPANDAVGAGNIDSAASQAEPGYGISVVPLQYVSASTLIKLLDSFATKAGTVRADAARNLLLIQGTGTERRAAIETVLSFDVDWMRGQSVGIYPIQNSNPEPMIAELEKIMDSGENGLGHDVVKFVPVARMNAILVVTRKPALLQTAAKWIQRLDNADTSRAGVHVYRIHYGEARQMARVLNEAFVGSSGSLDTAAEQIAPGSGSSLTSSGGLTQGKEFGTPNQQVASSFSRLGGLEQRGANTQVNVGTAGTAAAASNALEKGGNAPGGPPLLPGVRITADPVNNALLIYATQENYRIIERTVRQLDRPQMQVAIDATIAEVTLNDTLSYGVQAFLQSQSFGFKPDKGSVLNVPSSPPGAQPTVTNGVASAFLNRAFPGFNFLIGPESQPNAILDALRAITDLKVLSNPSLVVIDNQPATLMVGSDVPISTGSANVLTSNNTIVNTIDYRTVGIILRVVPRINVNGNVRLDIEQEISQVANGSSSSSSASSNSLTPTVSERKVRSSISVASGQTVLLAGLIQEQKELDRSGIPILEQLPTVGDAFSHQTKTTSRTELIVFIRPQIIRDGRDAHFVAEELRSKLRGKLGSAGEPPASKQR
ncbi:MAG: type II secretion system secretin GspD, partial [Bradyrhizobiaceae bacterium]|nr:type II secretion system secretin GspD [Bradyrhizobiaceae bacterium]